MNEIRLLLSLRVDDWWSLMAISGQGALWVVIRASSPQTPEVPDPRHAASGARHGMSSMANSKCIGGLRWS